VTVRLIGLLCFAAVLSACSSSAQTSSQILPGISSTRTASESAAAPSAYRGAGTLIVRVTLARMQLRSHYLGPATAKISVKITGPSNFKKTASLKLTGTGCKSKLMTVECTLNVPGLAACPSKAACYTGSVSTYDAAKHLLSADQKFKFAITSASTIVPLVLYAIPASIAFFPGDSSTLTGTQSSGFIDPKCTASAQTVDLLAADADGNFIVGVGSPTLSLSSGDTSQMTVAAGATPGTFALNPPASPAYPYGNHAIVLSATATPSKHSGGHPVSTPVNVTYSGDICGVFTEFAIPSGSSSEPWGITTGPDGAIWFAEAGANKVGRITTDGTITEFPLSASATPVEIVTGPDNNLWVTENAAAKIAKVTTSGSVTEFNTPTASSHPLGIAVGPDGNLWFAECVGNIGTATTSGTITEYPVITTSSRPAGITAGPDGKLWFTEFQNDAVGSITTSGSVVEYGIPTASSMPVGIRTGSDGQLWFSESAGNKVGRLKATLTATGIDSEYTLPEGSSAPYFMASGPDGDMWVAELAGNRIASITAGGAIKEFSVPTTASDPVEVLNGPDGSVWFTELAAGKIGRLR
jgi:streptogramin lyase